MIDAKQGRGLTRNSPDQLRKNPNCNLKRENIQLQRQKNETYLHKLIVTSNRKAKEVNAQLEELAKLS